jgi:uncharacterized protein YbjT (DUF2867 family)
MTKTSYFCILFWQNALLFFKRRNSMQPSGNTIVVTGATGLQGSNVVKQLVTAGWTVKALTRNPNSSKAQHVRDMGAELLQGDMSNQVELVKLFRHAYGVYSLQNPYLNSTEDEIRLGMNVNNAAAYCEVEHLVYASAGIGEFTGVPSWDSKVNVEAHLHALKIPCTILRPMALMELMTDPKFFPPIAVWHVMPAVMGEGKQIPWISAYDMAMMTERVFSNTELIGKEINVAGDLKSIAECREIYRNVMGTRPKHYPLPAWLFKQFGLVGKDLTAMWRWLGANTLGINTDSTRQLLPEVMNVETWMRWKNEVGEN